MVLPATGKLVRDRIPEIIRKSGGNPATEIISHVDLRDALCRKLSEEVDEYFGAGTSESRLEELADIVEVIRGILHEMDLGWDVLMDVAEKKRTERGGFNEGVWLK